MTVSKDSEYMMTSPKIKVFDFFSGCGGTSKGLQTAGMDIVLGLDIDKDSEATYLANFLGAEFIRQDISSVETQSIKNAIQKCGSSPLLFCGCAPCQPFTKQNTLKKTDDVRAPLLNEFQRFVEYYEPEYVFVENVPGMQKIKNEKSPFTDFITALKLKGYSVSYAVKAAQNYGVPQYRRRLVLIASRLGYIDLPGETHGEGENKEKYATVWDYISDLPSIRAGEEHPEIPNHRAANLSELNLKRIKAMPPGGSRKDWPDELKLDCHAENYSGHTDVYGRMKWNAPASGLTTRCISLSNGRFGHPDQDRAISAREAACLQTFPMDFVFHGNLGSVARQIGNAVPVKLAEVFGQHIINHYNIFKEMRLAS